MSARTKSEMQSTIAESKSRCNIKLPEKNKIYKFMESEKETLSKIDKRQRWIHLKGLIKSELDIDIKDNFAKILAKAEIVVNRTGDIVSYSRVDPPRNSRPKIINQSIDITPIEIISLDAESEAESLSNPNPLTL